MRAPHFKVIDRTGREAVPDLTLVIPAYNEAARLPTTLAAIQAELDQWPWNYQVLVVDDGSSDATNSVTAQFDARFSCLSLAKNQGKGAAVCAGMLQATGRVIAFTDADLPFDLQSLREGVSRILANECAVICGDRTRDHQPGPHQKTVTVFRKLSGFVFRQIVWWLVAPPISDTQCGLKIFRKDAAHEIFRHVEAKGFAFDVDVICQADRLGYTLSTVPVQLVNTEGSTISLRRHSWPMLKELIAIRQRLQTQPAVLSLAKTSETPVDETRRRAA